MFAPASRAGSPTGWAMGVTRRNRPWKAGHMIGGMDDAVARYRTASEANDLDALIDTLADDVAIVSPISGRMVFQGKDDARGLLGAVYGSLQNLRWTQTFGEGHHRAVLGEFRVAGIRMTDAMVFELAADGRIRRISPHLRPWLGLTVFAALVGPKVSRRPGVVWRALMS